MKDVKELLREFWQIRFNQQIEQAFLLAARIREIAATLSAFEIQAEMAAMEASLLRSRGQIQDSDAIVSTMQSQLTAKNQLFPARLLMERGLNAFYKEDYAKALEDFLLVSSRTHPEGDLPLLAFARLNALLCSEYLNLPTDNLYKSLQDILQSPSLRAIPGLIRQWNAYCVREHWRLGRFAELEHISSQDWDQATYHLLYLHALPMVTHPQRKDFRVENFLEGRANLYLKSYRMRTLTGHSHPDDLSVAKFSDLVDRIYLWTWFWLTSPFPLEKVLSLLALCPDRLFEQPLTAQTTQMLLLAMDWVTLFQPTLRIRLRGLREALKEIQGSTPLAPAFELEHLVNSALLAEFNRNLLERQETEYLLKSHELWNSAFLRWPGVFSEADTDPRLNYFRSNCHELMNRVAPAKTDQIIVHLDAMEIERQIDGQKMQSEAACLALRLLKEKTSVTCEEFMLVAFGQKGYEDYLHENRIANLLTRLRPWLPEALILRKRGEWIRSEGSWDKIVVKGSPLPTAPSFPPKLNSIKRKTKQVTAKSTSLMQLQDLGLSLFSRKDLETKLDKSRATINRLLETWMREGMISASGQGRATKYYLNEHWRSL